MRERSAELLSGAVVALLLTAGAAADGPPLMSAACPLIAAAVLSLTALARVRASAMMA